MEKITINTEYITLAQVLKLKDFIASGGEAKIACQCMEIYVNDELENRRGRKLYDQDIVEIEGQKFVIVNAD